MTPQSVYESQVLLPILPFLTSIAVLAIAIPRAAKDFANGWAALFAVLIAMDAWLNGPWTFIVPNTAWATAAGVTFVIVGDFRYFILVERAIGGNPFFVFVRAVAFAFIVPLTMQAGRALWPAIFGASGLRLFLAYETLFLILALVLRFIVLPRRLTAASESNQKIAMTLTRFELAQYALWALADIVILVFKIDAGYLLRIVPNLMYYVVFVPWAKTILRPR